MIGTPPRAYRPEIPAYASSSISGSVKIENAVDSATPREASELSQWYISLCMAVVAAQGHGGANVQHAHYRRGDP